MGAGAVVVFFLIWICVAALFWDPAPKCVEQKRSPDGNMQCVLREGELPCDTWILVHDKWECK